MHLTPDTSTSVPKTRQRGFSLIEVLVALLILSIGILGLAALQTFSLRFNSQSYTRTQATILINDMFDRMRTNVDGLATYNAVAPATPASGYATSCFPASCATPADIANYHIAQWKALIVAPGMLPGGQGGIARNGSMYTVTITWVENNITMTQSVTALVL
jgi:type IV pilus assembly protein PilV